MKQHFCFQRESIEKLKCARSLDRLKTKAIMALSRTKQDGTDIRLFEVLFNLFFVRYNPL